MVYIKEVAAVTIIEARKGQSAQIRFRTLDHSL